MTPLPKMPRAVRCSHCPLRAAGLFRELTGQELAFVETFKIGELTAEAGSTLILEGASSPHLYTIFQGWAFRYKSLEDGRRQVLNYAMAGDFLGLQGSIMDAMGHGVEALTPVRLCVFSRERLWNLYENHPALGYDITWLAANEERALENQLLTVGRRTAVEKLAFTLWFLYRRAERVGLAKDGAMDLPLTQQHLADTIGMSLVHTNKTLQRLRATKCVRWDGQGFQITNEERLLEIAQADRDDMSARPLI